MKTYNIEETIYQDLMNRYKKSVLNKQELSNEIGISVGSINNYITKGYGIPQYKKIGGSRNSRVVFPIIYVSEYLSNVSLVS